MDELRYATAVQLATAIRTRRVSSAEVVASHLDLMDQRNPELNAIVTRDDERALARAAEADVASQRGEFWGPLHGVPVTIKDTLSTAGLRTTAGYPPLQDHVPNEDATAVARLKAAGGIVVGKTNVPILAADGQTNNPIFGRTNNPWDPALTPGGSTGGGAAAVASGMSPLEIGSDLAGSGRTPAHYCGTFSLKPTEHRVPLTGHIPDLPGGARGIRHMGVIAPLARSVEDLELVLSLVAGPDGRDWEVPPAPLGTEPPRELSGLRIAWADDLGRLPVTRASATALKRVATLLATSGAMVEQRHPDGFDMVQAWESWGELVRSEIGSTMTPEEEAEHAARKDIRPDSDVPILRGMAHGLGASMRQFTTTLAKRDALITAMEQFLDEWDVFLCPVAVGPAFPHCEPGTRVAVDGTTVPYLLATTGYTCPFSLTGHPVVVLPIAGDAELPIGMQVIGKRWADTRVLAIARQLSEMIGPFRSPGRYDAVDPAALG